MYEPDQAVNRLRAELTELRRHVRDSERDGQRIEQLQLALQAVRRAQDAGETPALRAAQDDVETQLDRYRQALRRAHQLTVKIDKVRAAGHADLIETTPAVASAASRVASQAHAVRDLVRDHLPGAMVSPRSAQASKAQEG
jgi:hypothetical protein